MALTELQEKWIADVLGVDQRKFPGARARRAHRAAKAPRRGPRPSRPDAGAQWRLPSTRPGSSRSRSTMGGGQSDRKLRFIKAENDGGRFDPSPPEEIAPKKKVSFRALDTGAKGGTLIYQLEAKEGAGEEPDQLPWWNMSWKPARRPAAAAGLDARSRMEGLLPADGAGKNSIAFMLTGASAVTQTGAPPQATQGPAGQQRIDVTFVNRSDRWLKYWGADKMTVTFDRKPPDELKPGASATFAIFAKGSDEIHFGLMYSIVATADAKADASAPKWTPHFTIPAGTGVMVPDSDIVPGIDGLKSSENPGTDAVSFVLGQGRSTAQQPQPPAQSKGPEQRIPITFTNNSDMVLRYWGADKMDVVFDQKPPELIEPGQSLGFVVTGKRGSRIHFGLMYSIVANETDKAATGTPKWTPHFNIPPGEQE